MKKFNKEVGNYGENIAKNYLISKNYELLELNYRNRYGEIDIICFDKDVIVFVEVKSRFDTSFGNPLEAINLKKQKKIVNLSLLYIIKKRFTNCKSYLKTISLIISFCNSSLIIRIIFSFP
mgnify:CR=1 FL=1